MLIALPMLTQIVLLPAVGSALRGASLSLHLCPVFVLWEARRTATHLLVAVWCGPPKKHAAIQFFMSTFLARLPLLVASSAFYFCSRPHTFAMPPIIDTMPI